LLAIEVNGLMFGVMSQNMARKQIGPTLFPFKSFFNEKKMNSRCGWVVVLWIKSRILFKTSD